MRGTTNNTNLIAGSVHKGDPNMLIAVPAKGLVLNGTEALVVSTLTLKFKYYSCIVTTTDDW